MKILITTDCPPLRGHPDRDYEFYREEIVHLIIDNREKEVRFTDLAGYHYTIDRKHTEIEFIQEVDDGK